MKSEVEIRERLAKSEEWLAECQGHGCAEEDYELGQVDALRWVIDDEQRSTAALINDIQAWLNGI